MTRLLLILACLSGCAGKSYEQIDEGQLSGKLTVEWYAQEQFLFRPDKTDPLTFVRPDGSRLQPGQFRTDGGSIPRPIRAFKHYSPWGYAPAFIVHDWIYAEHHCGRLPEIDFETSATIMSEVVKTMMETPRYGPPLPGVLESMDFAVRTPIARTVWENGECLPTDIPPFRQRPLQTFTVAF